MSFNSSLKIEDLEYRVITFNYSTFREVDVFGRPTSIFYGIRFKLEIEHKADCVILHQWAFKNYEVKSGSILFMKRDNVHQKDTEFRFKDAHISRVEFDFSNTGDNPLVERIEIVSGFVEIESEGKIAEYIVTPV